MATPNSDDNTSSDHDPVELSSEEDRTSPKRQKLGETEKEKEKESGKEESQGSGDEKVSNPPEEDPDEESDVELDDEDESDLDELIFHLRGEEIFFIEDRQKQLEAAKQGQEEDSSSSLPLPMLIIHHSEGDFFEKRAQEAKKALEERIPGIYVYVNSRQKYRLGIFYIRSEEQEQFIGLRMEPPFTELVELDMENLAWEISVFIRS
ncbi:unnamed protein product [Lupinus luteus]|uniref:Uncharacterized protein n=1 Tax=Lupinus luteus TaxID=3873 RepID=A0AAV1Y0Z0_LUPLU